MKIIFFSNLMLLLCVNLYSQKEKLRYGDLLFQQVDCGSFCEAIERVTPSYKNNLINHVGMVVFEESNIYVFEATSKGVIFTYLDTFVNRSGKDKIWIGRLSKKYIPSYNELLTYVNKPYDTVFDISNDAFYCSELIYFLYKNTRNNKHFFSLQPMTFKEPNNQDYFPVWEEYFKRMNVQIPEGKLGINPGAMMNEKRIKIKHYKCNKN